MRQHALKDSRVELDDALRQVVKASKVICLWPRRKLLQGLKLGLALWDTVGSASRARVDHRLDAAHLGDLLLVLRQQPLS